MKKTVLALILFVVIAGVLFLLLATYFHLSIANHSDKRIEVDQVVIGVLPLQNKSVALEPREVYSIPAFKFAASQVLFVEMKSDGGIKKNASCVLDVAGSDSCRISILSDGTLDCSECYK